MRAQTVQATMVVTIATALHSIAVGNMLPTYYEDPKRGRGTPDGLCGYQRICRVQTQRPRVPPSPRRRHQCPGFMSILRGVMEQEIVRS